jgi:hypothetical protein
MPISATPNAAQPEQARWAIWDAKWPKKAPSSFKLVACKDMRTNFPQSEKRKAYVEKGYIKVPIPWSPWLT